MTWTYMAVILLTSFGLSVAANQICPENSGNNTRSPFGAENYVQRGLWHQILCPAFRTGESVDRVVWFKQDAPTEATRLISRIGNVDTPESFRYAFGTSGFSLVIKGVVQSDGGRYVCHVLPRDTISRFGNVDIQVQGDTFPGGSSQSSLTASFHPGRRQTLPCECVSQTPDVVYWSTGEGVTTDTHIIGARFSDGATLQIQHGANYSIGSDASLTVNSPNDVHDTQRFWCHVFQLDGTLRNCSTNVQIADEAESADALKASESSFYLQNDTQQILPCPSWTPGDTACEMEWSKLDNPVRQVLSYNLSTGVVDSSPGFDLSSDFGLVIQSVDDDHAGVYRCAVGGEHPMDVDVRVIGDLFPLDKGDVTEGDSVTFHPETRFSLHCPALSDISMTTKATLFWSFGAPDAESTTVIGTLNLPDGPVKMADLGKDCLDISMEGALTFNNCSQDSDVRYWCHVFSANDDVIRSYVDVSKAKSNCVPATLDIAAIAVCVPLVIVLPMIALILIWKRRRQSSRSKEDKERGDCKPLLKPDPAVQLDSKALAKKTKSFVISKLNRIPITPWVDGDDACFAPIDTVYIPLEMFANVSNESSTVKYPLDSKSDILNDGIQELARKYVIIQGRRGCGKTTILRRVLYDWAMQRRCALWGEDQMVVLVSARLLINAKTIGKAIVACMLQKDANISAESINAHYSRDKSNLTILVDDCNDKDDIDAVMKVMTDNDFLGCQLVLTTRNSELAEEASREHKMRHVIINGFTLPNAIEYINVVLDTVEDREKSTPEHKAVKSEGEPKSGSTADMRTEQHKTDTEQPQNLLMLLEAKESKTSDTVTEKIEAPKTPKIKKKRNLHRYLEEDILPSDLTCLPAVLAALCKLSIWTKGDAFKPDVTMTNLFLRFVKCMFNRTKTHGVIDVIEGNQLSLLSEDQLDVLAELGRVGHSRLVEGCAKYEYFSTEDLFSSSMKGEHILEVAVDIGILTLLAFDCRECSKVECREEITETISAKVSEVEIRKGCLCCKRKQKQQIGTERDPLRQDTELTPLTSPKDESFRFVLEILEQLCVGVYLPQATKKMTKWFDDITEIGHWGILGRFSNAFQFAIQDKAFDREALVDWCATIINRGYSQARPFHVVLELQKFVELCLQLNFEGQWEGNLNKKLKSIFPEGRVCLIGVSGFKLRLLSYLFEHAEAEDKSKLNVKSVELLRIGRYDWSELQEYIECFISGKKRQKNTKVKITEESQPAAPAIHQGTVPASDKGITTPTEPSPVPNHPLETEDINAEHRVESWKTGPHKNESQTSSENKPISANGQAAAEDPRSDSDKPSLGTPQSDLPQHPLAPERMNGEQRYVTAIENNEPQMHVNPEAKVVSENAPGTPQQTDTGGSPDNKIKGVGAVKPSSAKASFSERADTENKSDDVSPVPQSEDKVDGSPSEVGKDDKSVDQSTEVDIASYEMIYSESDSEVVKQLRKRVESSNEDMPRFPPGESDISVLHTMSYYGLQEILESQAGECYSSGAARDFARYLPRLEMLESLVLVGTILSSDAICEFAKSAQQLPNLKKLDLRLNRQFDDRAFVAVTNLPLRECNKLTDLRLSLNRVSIKAFDEVQVEMEKSGDYSWGRLKTLYLLHGSPAETFVGFLNNSLNYFHNVKHFHVSALYKQNKIKESTQEEFVKTMRNQKIMPNLKDLDIGNMEPLKAKLDSLKLPKKKKGSVVQNLDISIVKPLKERLLGKKTASGNAESIMGKPDVGQRAKSTKESTGREDEPAAALDVKKSIPGNHDA